MQSSHKRGSIASGASNGSFFSRSFTRRDTGRTDDSVDFPKGAIGLTTLHDPEEDAVADIIFVHGLNGGSESTWTKNGNPSLFWPSAWLPNDEAFKDVRIHTFGYASGLSKDMGGLVIKKAFVLGHQTKEFEGLIRNIFAIFFLATPHQGAGIADTLGRILALAPGSRPFVQDLSPESPVLQSINEEFPLYSSSLRLFSFYETEPMKIGIGTQLIVEKHCAVMNYPNERRTYLNANHRNVAKFSLQTDPSYLAVRNALATTIASKRTPKALSNQTAGFEQIEALSTFLSVTETPDDELESQSTRLSETCDWFLDRNAFQEWRKAADSKTLWVRGRPGAGKSVLSAHIIHHLRGLGLDCSFYFFVQGDKTKATINTFLRSMAWQMASQHPHLLSIVLDISTSSQITGINKTDHVAVWRRLFLSGMLKCRLDTPQYWVIDAVDECKGGSELVTLLSKMQEVWPISLLITSRDSFDRYADGAVQRIEVMSETIQEEDTNKDIAQYLRSCQDQLPATGAAEREAMSQEILKNANGCFLWVTLVLKELRQVHTSTEIRKVLSSNTADMDEMYGRILNDMANAKFGKELAKAILVWTTFAFRFLSTDEMHCAIELDIHDKIDDIERSISTCCGNLVYVDRSKRVQLLHLTVRDFLTRQGMRSEFQIERATAHKRLALVCLRYLTRSQARPTKPRKLSVDQIPEKPRLMDYASEYVFQHIFHVTSSDNEVLTLLGKFMGSDCVLKWIEHLARKGDLEKVYQAGKTLNNLLGRLAQHSPLVGLRKELTVLHSWGNDLTHLVTKFGKELSFSPSAIHRLIPPFCPVDSAPSRQFSSPHRGLSVLGQSTEGWQDCLAILNYTKPARPLTVATSQRFFGLGLSTGKVMIYDDVTCQEETVLQHGEPVWALAFSETGLTCASAGAKSIKVWNVMNWTEVFRFAIPVMCLSLAFSEEDMLLFAATKKNELMCWNLANGGVPEDVADWTIDFDEQSSVQSKQPTLAVFCPQQSILAIVYRGEDIVLWDYERDRVYDLYDKETGSTLHGPLKVSDGSTTVWSLQFSTLRDETLLAAAYSDGDLVIYDTLHGTVRDLIIGVNAQKLSCSPDGRTLACADSLGTIQLFDMETVKLLYRLEFEGDAIAPRTLAFTSDNHRIIDIRANQCRLWDPAVLLRQDVDDENSDTISVSTAPHEASFRGSMSTHITALECISLASSVFCGKEDGSVHIYDISREPKGTELFKQTVGIPIILLHFNAESMILACSDAASRVTIRQMKRDGRKSWTAAAPYIDTVIGRGITGLLLNAKHSRCLVATDEETHLWSTSQDAKQASLVTMQPERKGHWVHHGSNADILLFVSATSARMCSWTTLELSHTISLSNLTEPFTAIGRVRSLRHPRYFIGISVDPSRVRSSQNVIRMYDYNDFNLDMEQVASVQDLGTLSSNVHTIIGIFSERLVFLDTNNWVRSLEINTDDAMPVRHFFIPNDWVSLVQGLVLDIGHSGEIIFVKRGELLVIKRGLDMTDQGILTPRKRSMSPRSAMFGGLAHRTMSH
ncbi:uncharacterized protein J4E84_002351 [Alternaria hordeiaustralica]|uniref:uncharacterized protein n=1 Tax=Alternaria hordeiaustralica TaxID=1187925 RepID=UPI0020C283E3|nr:uncharacterized protein J4E84_002351 [Alternaria hordeiaustralica]KAI4693775.1 hypothetical protein J4E84_002351 [Alternaria hordeiaustralica]